MLLGLVVSVGNCKHCIKNEAIYLCKGQCIGCTARWILRHDKEQRLKMIEDNGFIDIDELKQVVTNMAKRVKNGM